MWYRKKSRSWTECEKIARQVAESYVQIFFDNPDHRGPNFSRETPASMARVSVYSNFIDREWERFGDELEQVAYEHALEFYDQMEVEQ